MKSTTPRCRICRRPLSDQKSIAKGIGPECAAKWAWMLCNAGLTLEALGIPETISTEPSVRRYLHVAEQALLAGRKSDLDRFKTAAREAAQRLIPAMATTSGGYR